ncbi:TRAP-type C4-dicarboxylate transport system substrate-binding protein [Caldalkalibacillus uzonensis]|uniref:TRAP-type C4-dicarboxylate transport system substrate-binding protein n=1 Tax=Caldalkalibacillus uzonensis TaxID=353224 RepID=A0ABU0CQJ6_9BACI|nr:C4-dicarboxylate TRAP transporter substrate-binding protein [Caldalkalibacillus uzonensis]MDQ0338358.1 TRAP-type C4-dicarboxylate transport system substrate-binding protein [Caldalkalibacillus uzonensis]
MRSSSRERLLILFVSMVVVMLLVACGQSTETGGESANGGEGSQVAGDSEKTVITLRIGAGAPLESSVWLHPIKNYFMPEVDRALESTPYEINWVENWGTITNMSGELETIEAGILDVGFMTAAFQPRHLMISSMGFNTPFSSSDPEIIAEVAMRMKDEFEEFAGEYDAVNAKLLGFAISENYSLITTFPVEKMEDMEGRKVAGASANQRWLQASGAIPVQSALTEAYQSLQSGVYEGWVIFTSSVMGFRLYEQAKYLTNVNFGSMNLGGLVVNNDTWNSLPPEVQKVFEEVGSEFTYRSAKYAKEVEQSNFEEMEKQGVQISNLPLEEEKRWAERLVGMPQDYAEEMNQAGLPGTELMRAFIQFQIDAGHEFPVPYEIE